MDVSPTVCVTGCVSAQQSVRQVQFEKHFRPLSKSETKIKFWQG